VPIVLTLLDEVRWGDERVVGERPQALLAALADGRSVRAEQLADRVWGEDVPANPTKALQVLVSRTRGACGPGAVQRSGDGYRLGLNPDEVDSQVVRERTAAARASLSTDPAAAAELAGSALELGKALADGPVAEDEHGPLAAVRRDAVRALRAARRVLAQAWSRTGIHEAALPLLEEAVALQADDEELLTDLLRSLAAVRGNGAALERFELFRADLRDRLGADPGADLQRVHQELLSLDRPVRDGVQYDATTLLGRGEDLRRLRAALVASRVVSVLGAGGLGKTRLAHVIGRTAPQPVVHFVELVGVTVPDDVVAEVGSALGVRDTVSGRRTLTPQQRADVRARIAQHLDQAPSLLILDNCEHVIGAVADLVAYLVATTRELRVLTTTRAPLAIAAERVYPLGELGAADASELFVQRAVAARPDVVLDDAAVLDIVERLDGLPLAIELAAAKVRVMSTADIARRLENRFALLRGGDRSAPDRHRTLLAVIDWSWNLLGEDEKRALRWLSVFHDGFTLEGAEHLLGPSALDAVQDLASQSLLAVGESGSGVRYRMLETVREFGRMQLVDAGEDGGARTAQRAWALDLAGRHLPGFAGPDQFAAVDAIRAEENNLADVLRQALAEPDPEAVVRIMAGLGTYWMILGDHVRVFTLADAVAEAVHGWTPPPEHADATRIAVAVTLNNSFIGGLESTERLRGYLLELGPGETDSRVAALVTIMQDFTPGDINGFLSTLRVKAQSADRQVALGALQFLSVALENNGDPAGGLEAAERAITLVEPEDGAWLPAMLHTQIAQLAMQAGRPEEAVTHAQEAFPVLDRLGASDDSLQLRSLLALSAIHDGDLGRAAAEIARLDGQDITRVFGGNLVVSLGSAELALARGDHEAGLAGYRRAVQKVRGLRFPGVETTGLEPWVLYAEATALTVHAYVGPDDAVAQDLLDNTRRNLAAVLDPAFPYPDLPVCGMSMFGLGAWGALRGALPVEDAVRLVVLADRFAYNRTLPTMSWDRMAGRLDEIAPGLLARFDEEYGARRGPALMDEARALVAAVGR